jgi:hypothetical protein
MYTYFIPWNKILDAAYVEEMVPNLHIVLTWYKKSTQKKQGRAQACSFRDNSHLRTTVIIIITVR